MTDYLSSHAVAKLVHASPSAVLNWIDDGLLPAYRTPGGHRRVQHDALIKFLRDHEMPVPGPLAAQESMKLYIVSFRTKPKNRQRKTRIIRHISMAGNTTAAIEQVRDNRSADDPREAGSWTAKELKEPHCLLDVVLK